MIDILVDTLSGLFEVAGPLILVLRFVRARRAYKDARHAYFEAVVSAQGVEPKGLFAVASVRHGARMFAFEESRRPVQDFLTDVVCSFAFSVFGLYFGGFGLAKLMLSVGTVVSLVITLEGRRGARPDDNTRERARVRLATR